MLMRMSNRIICKNTPAIVWNPPEMAHFKLNICFHLNEEKCRRVTESNDGNNPSMESRGSMLKFMTGKGMEIIEALKQT